VDERRHPGALRNVPGDGQALAAGPTRWLRLLTSHSRYCWGLKLYLVCTDDGMPIMWCLAHPKIGERDVFLALLEHNHHLTRDGQILLADKGFAGAEFKQLTTAAQQLGEQTRPAEFDIALSFAGEDRPYAERLAVFFARGRSLSSTMRTSRRSSGARTVVYRADRA
jgi:hypothetical protein